MSLYVAIVSVGVLLWLAVQRWLTPVQGATLPSLDTAAGKRRLLRDLPAALENGDIFLVYQPKLGLRSGEIDGVEALVRWDHPFFGQVPRTALILLAEERGRIRELTVWVLRQAVNDQAVLAASGHAVSFHVNVSAGLLADDAFIRDVFSLTASAKGAIGLEITETALIENSPLALENLQRLISRGISISIDDYGSGLSSLAYLKELPAKELKIDKMFVSGMTMSHRDPLIVRSTIDLAHALGLAVVAEGVESLAALALLKVMGCDMAQGYLISPALPIAALERYLVAGHYRSILSTAVAGSIPSTAFWARTRRDETAQPKRLSAI